MDLDTALHELLPEGSDTDETALIAAAREAWRRRQVNTDAGGAVIAELRARGLSWRQVEEATGIPKDTASRWSRPPGADTA